MLPSPRLPAPAGSKAPRELPPSAAAWVSDKRSALTELMWQGAGIVRSVPDMQVRLASSHAPPACLMHPSTCAAAPHSKHLPVLAAGGWAAGASHPPPALPCLTVQASLRAIAELYVDSKALAESYGVSTGEPACLQSCLHSPQRAAPQSLQCTALDLRSSCSHCF